MTANNNALHSSLMIILLFTYVTSIPVTPDSNNPPSTTSTNTSSNSSSSTSSTSSSSTSSSSSSSTSSTSSSNTSEPAVDISEHYINNIVVQAAQDICDGYRNQRIPSTSNSCFMGVSSHMKGCCGEKHYCCGNYSQAVCCPRNENCNFDKYEGKFYCGDETIVLPSGQAVQDICDGYQNESISSCFLGGNNPRGCCKEEHFCCGNKVQAVCCSRNEDCKHDKYDGKYYCHHNYWVSLTSIPAYWLIIISSYVVLTRKLRSLNQVTVVAHNAVQYTVNNPHYTGSS